MLKIQRSIKAGNVRFALSGRVESEHVAELQRLIEEEASRHLITLDLEGVRLVARDAVAFLARCEATRIRLENCPAYVREWIGTEGHAPGHPSRTTRR